ncbi:site-specific integrase [Bradyrhizobium sp. NC92]|uniref:site-specific integrase n=1 Tax=Bradyrhizobium sp. (strain NC92) TaxID=55395 RepID=UPI0021AACDAF|nr:site-specific integrase [Bradyrhizobium sp. NC92]UWU65549.1 site-specific integrase [Bradyrhizobium sp. NC92]
MEDVPHPRLHKRKNTYYLRASYPADLQHLFKGKERWKSLGTSDYREAVRRVRAASSAFDAEMDRLRATDVGPPANLSQQEIVRLCGKAYEFAIRQWGARPGGPVIYEKFIDKMVRTESPTELEAEIGPHLAELLSRSSTVGKIDEDTRARFLPALRDTIRDAATTLLRRANNDYGTDHLVQRFGEALKRPAGGLSLRQLMDDYLADPSVTRGEKTLLSYRIVFDAIEELVGPDKLVRDVIRADCKRVRSLLQTIPKNARKVYPGKSLQEAARLAKIDGKPLMSVGTINSYLINLSSLFNWAVKEEHADRNPAADLQLADPVKDKNKRKPVPLGDLPKLFQMPLYTGCVDDENGYAKSGPNHPRRGRFWVPLLALFHGLRQGEACQLHKTDVRQVGNVWCLMLSEGDPAEMEVEDRKRIKTEAGERFVPLHAELIAMGFLDFVRSCNGVRLFPELERDSYGYFSTMSKWFGRFLAKAGVKQPRVTFHSLRHNYRDALSRARLSRDVIRALGGWASDGVDDDYGGDLEAFVSVLAEAVAKVSYEGLNLQHLHVSTPPARAVA